jgi:hypothetical protein
VPLIFLVSVPLALLSPLAAMLTWLVTLGVGPRAVRSWTKRHRSH